MIYIEAEMAKKIKITWQWGRVNVIDWLQQIGTGLEVFFVAVFSLPFTLIGVFRESRPRKPDDRE